MIYLKQIEDEKQKIEQVNLEIAKYEELILKQEKKLNGEAAARNNDELISHQITLLRGRVDKQLTEVQNLRHKNTSLKSNIENLRQERVKYDIIYRKYEDLLHDKKREMSLVIEDSKNAYQYREMMLIEVGKLKDKADHEKKSKPHIAHNLNNKMNRSVFNVRITLFMLLINPIIR